MISNIVLIRMAEPEVAVEGDLVKPKDESFDGFPLSVAGNENSSSFALAILPPSSPVHVKEEPLDDPINEYQIPNAPQTLIEPKEGSMEIDQFLPQDYMISASEFMRDEKMIKKEEVDIENNEGVTTNFIPIFTDSLELLDKQPRMDGGTMAEENSYSQQQINIFHDHSYCINPLKSLIKRPSTRERNNWNLEAHLSKIFQEKRPTKQSDTDMKCPKCEYYTRRALAWVMHLRNKHSTTPDQAGFALLCECGIVSQTSGHSRRCEIANFTVISRSPIIHVAKATPQCVLCEVYPKTAYGYAQHLYVHHKSTLNQNGVFLKCSCGLEVRYTTNHNHLENCNPRQFTLYKLHEE